MYVKPLLVSVETAMDSASCCWLGGNMSPMTASTPLGTVQVPGVFLGRTPTGLCADNPFPTCQNPLTGSFCVVSPKFETAAISLGEMVTISGMSGSVTLSGLP